MIAEQIIEHLRRGIDHGITITPYEAARLVELFDSLKADAEAWRARETRIERERQDLNRRVKDCLSNGK